MSSTKAFEQLFERELGDLYEDGKEFSRAHPDRAGFLDIDKIKDRDPYVERLFEGFAFLTARVREKLDGSMQKFMGAMIDLMWPHYNKAVPSLSIVQFSPRPKRLKRSLVLPRGTAVHSAPVGNESAVCRFRTIQDVTLLPLTLVNVDRDVAVRDKPVLRFHFRLEEEFNPSVLDCPSIRLYLHDELPTALRLHEYFARRVAKATISESVSGTEQVLEACQAISSAGFSTHELLLPDERRHFLGHALLRDYFIFPEKYLFIDLHGFDQLWPQCVPGATLTYSVTFDRELPSKLPFNRQSFRLFCSPAVNIFEQEIEPIINTGKRSEYPLVADAGYPTTVQIHSLTAVEGKDEQSGEAITFEPARKFLAGLKPHCRSYLTHFQRAPRGGQHCLIELGGSQLVNNNLHSTTLSMRGWCYNGTLPREELRERGLGKLTPQLAERVKVTNLTRPTPPFLPPPEEEYEKIYLTHMGLAHTTLARVDGLKALLSIYDWSNAEGRTRRIEAITAVSSRPAQKEYAGGIIRGVEIDVSLQEAAFSDLNDLHLFGMVLHRFFNLQAPINTYVDLSLTSKPTNAVQWFRQDKM